MEQLIADLKSIPGVIGAAGYRSKQGITHSNLPALFKTEKLDVVAKHLIKINSAGRLNFPDLGEVLINYEEAVILCRQVNGDEFLTVICDPSINLNLLAMSANLAVEEYEQGRRSAPTETAAPAAAPPSAPAPQPSAAAGKVDIDALRGNGPLAAPLQVMEELLSKVMGPMATIVFADALEIWCKSSQPTAATMPKLLEIICQEFGDDDKARDYRDMVRSRLSSRGKK